MLLQIHRAKLLQLFLRIHWTNRGNLAIKSYQANGTHIGELHAEKIAALVYVSTIALLAYLLAHSFLNHSLCFAIFDYSKGKTGLSLTIFFCSHGNHSGSVCLVLKNLLLFFSLHMDLLLQRKPGNEMLSYDEKKVYIV